MSPESFTKSPERSRVPVRVFVRSQAPSPFIGRQAAQAVEEAKAHGFGDVSVISVDRPHGPLPVEVLQFFAQSPGLIDLQ